MPIPEVEFRETENGEPCHKYFLDGKEIPGLSYILESNGFLRYGKVKKDVMEAARERGDAADVACNLYDEDNFKIDSALELAEWEDKALHEPLDSWTRSRLTGWIKFRLDFHADPMLIQKAMSAEYNGMLYAFRLDRYMQMKTGAGIVEIKCTADDEPSHAIQTAAQALPFKDGSQVLRYGVYLRENDYKLEEFKDRGDEKIFGAALACIWWKLGKGIK